MARAAAVAATAAAVLVGAAPAAFAGESKVCNAAFCNVTVGSGTEVTEVRATKIGQNRHVRGFFEVFGPEGVSAVGETTSADTTVFPAEGDVPKGELVCLRFFAETSGGRFVEVGTAQCTTSPF